jgi:formylglycine-generating enzyme required for sulfatase activity
VSGDKKNRAIRGGSWYYRAPVARGVDPDGTDQDEDYGYLGFRLVHDSDDRVNRGGNWGYDASDARVADRGSAAPGARNGGLGFRLAKEST